MENDNYFPEVNNSEFELIKAIRDNKISQQQIISVINNEKMLEKLVILFKSCVSPEEILKIVADYQGMSVEDLKGSNNNKGLPYARMIAIYFINRYNRGLAPDAIATLFEKKTTKDVCGIIQNFQNVIHDEIISSKIIEDIERQILKVCN